MHVTTVLLFRTRVLGSASAQSGALLSSSESLPSLQQEKEQEISKHCKELENPVQELEQKQPPNEQSP